MCYFAVIFFHHSSGTTSLKFRDRTLSHQLWDSSWIEVRTPMINQVEEWWKQYKWINHSGSYFRGINFKNVISYFNFLCTMVLSIAQFMHNAPSDLLLLAERKFNVLYGINDPWKILVTSLVAAKVYFPKKNREKEKNGKSVNSVARKFNWLFYDIPNSFNMYLFFSQRFSPNFFPKDLLAKNTSVFSIATSFPFWGKRMSHKKTAPRSSPGNLFWKRTSAKDNGRKMMERIVPKRKSVKRHFSRMGQWNWVTRPFWYLSINFSCSLILAILCQIDFT